MKITWLINIVVPRLAEELGLWKTSLGGWLIGQMAGLRQTGHQLTVLCVSGEVQQTVFRRLDGVDYYVLPNQPEAELRAAFSQLLQKLQPDVFHIFGTETAAAAAAFDSYAPEKTVISIQGLVSVCAQHVVDGIPERYWKSNVLKRLGKRFLGGSVIEDDVTRLTLRGMDERRLLEKSRHVIGRTTWDRACVYLAAPQTQYHVCREILRAPFYAARWDVTACQRHRIFLSQAASPIKGLHQVLKALPLILKRYPDTEVYIAGAPFCDFSRRSPLKAWAVEYFCGYQGYIESLVRTYDLYGKIHFLNYLDENAMVEQYLKANVFVMPSTIENSPNSLGEAMLLGVPSVASCVGGVQDMMQSPEQGFVYPFEEPYMLAYYVCRIFESDALAMSISQAAHARAMVTHDMKTNTQMLLDVYDQIGSGGK